MENNKGILEKEKSLNHYKNLSGNYFNFPPSLNFVALEDFDRIQENAITNIILYSPNWGDITNEIIFNFLRKSNNPYIHRNHEIHLCQLLDTDHLFLITNIQKYLQL